MSRRSNFASTSGPGILPVQISTYREGSRSREKKNRTVSKKATPKPKPPADANVYEATLNRAPSAYADSPTEVENPSAEDEDYVDEDVEEVVFKKRPQNKKVSPCIPLRLEC
jgi:hypothetical protein